MRVHERNVHSLILSCFNVAAIREIKGINSITCTMHEAI